MDMNPLLQEAFRAAVLDQDASSLRLLLAPEEKDRLRAFASKHHWQAQNPSKKEQYLYGIAPFLYFKAGTLSVTVCFDIACRSTLNNAWVPLDRIVNRGALDRRRPDPKGGLFLLSYEDEICYLTAKCVYTEKTFGATDRSRLEEAMAHADQTLLLEKLQLVFFKFAPYMAEMLAKKDYDRIRAAFFAFADY